MFIGKKARQVISFLLIGIVAVGLLVGCDSNKKPYADAEALYNNGQFAEAETAFVALGDYKDAPARAEEAKEAAVIGSIAGSWSVAALKFYGSSAAGNVDMSFSVDEDGQKKDSFILLFDKSGSFSSDFNMVSDSMSAGESLDLTVYSGWTFINDSTDSNISGKLEFNPPPAQDYSYNLSLSQDGATMTLTIKQEYIMNDDSGYVIANGGKIPMTYTLTLVPTPN